MWVAYVDCNHQFGQYSIDNVQYIFPTGAQRDMQMQSYVKRDGASRWEKKQKLNAEFFVCNLPNSN